MKKVITLLLVAFTFVAQAQWSGSNRFEKVGGDRQYSGTQKVLDSTIIENNTRLSNRSADSSISSPTVVWRGVWYRGSDSTNHVKKVEAKYSPQNINRGRLKYSGDLSAVQINADTGIIVGKGQEQDYIGIAFRRAADLRTVGWDNTGTRFIFNDVGYFDGGSFGVQIGGAAIVYDRSGDNYIRVDGGVQGDLNLQTNGANTRLKINGSDGYVNINERLGIATGSPSTSIDINNTDGLTVGRGVDEDITGLTFNRSTTDETIGWSESNGTIQSSTDFESLGDLWAGNIRGNVSTLRFYSGAAGTRGFKFITGQGNNNYLDIADSNGGVSISGKEPVVQDSLFNVVGGAWVKSKLRVGKGVVLNSANNTTVITDANSTALLSFNVGASNDIFGSSNSTASKGYWEVNDVGAQIGYTFNSGSGTAEYGVDVSNSKVQIRTNNVNDVTYWSNTQMIVNELGNDFDVRFEGSSKSNLFNLNAGTNTIGIGTNSTTDLFNVGGNATVTGDVTVTGNVLVKYTQVTSSDTVESHIIGVANGGAQATIGLSQELENKCTETQVVEVLVKDEDGDASSFAITVETESNTNIDGVSKKQITTDYGQLSLYYSQVAGEWYIR